MHSQPTKYPGGSDRQATDSESGTQDQGQVWSGKFCDPKGHVGTVATILVGPRGLYLCLYSSLFINSAWTAAYMVTLKS